MHYKNFQRGHHLRKIYANAILKLHILRSHSGALMLTLKVNLMIIFSEINSMRIKFTKAYQLQHKFTKRNGSTLVEILDVFTIIYCRISGGAIICKINEENRCKYNS